MIKRRGRPETQPGAITPAPAECSVVSMFLWPQMTWAICGGRPLMIASVTKSCEVMRREHERVAGTAPRNQAFAQLRPKHEDLSS